MHSASGGVYTAYQVGTNLSVAIKQMNRALHRATSWKTEANTSHSREATEEGSHYQRDHCHEASEA